MTFEDVAMTDYFKHKVAYMGRTVFETKLTANGVLSNSLDLTAWHIDYIHRVSTNDNLLTVCLKSKTFFVMLWNVLKLRLVRSAFDCIVSTKV